MKNMKALQVMKSKKIYLIGAFLLLIVISIVLYINFTDHTEPVFEGTLVNGIRSIINL